MGRLFGFLSALIIASSLVWLAIYGAERLLPILIQLYSGRIGRAGHVFSIPFPTFAGAAVAILLSIQASRAKRDEDVPLTPLVRRLPSGLREL